MGLCATGAIQRWSPFSSDASLSVFLRAQDVLVAVDFRWWGTPSVARVAVCTAYGGIDLAGARDVLAASNFRGGVGDE